MASWMRFFKPLPEFVRGHVVAKIEDRDNSDDDDYSGEDEVVDSVAEAHIVTSMETGTQLHRPVLDIDFPVTVIPSSTPGHYHLYLDKPMPWSTYERFLQSLAHYGVVEGGYASASIDRGYSAVRLPWVKKSRNSTNKESK